MDGLTKQQGGSEFGGVYIKQIQGNSAADHDGRIEKGDRLVTINGINVENATKEKCTEMLELSQNKAVLHLERFIIRDFPPVNTVPTVVELNAVASGFGLRLAGGPEYGGIFVKALIAGGAAEKDGRILIGDKVVEINGTSVYGFAHQQVVEMLQNCTTAVLVLERYKQLQSKSEQMSRRTCSSSWEEADLLPKQRQQFMFPVYHYAVPSVPQKHLTHSIPSKGSAFKRFKQRQKKFTSHSMTNILHGTSASVQRNVQENTFSGPVSSFIQHNDPKYEAAALFSSQEIYEKMSSSDIAQSTGQTGPLSSAIFGKRHNNQNVHELHDLQDNVQRCAGPLNGNTELASTYQMSVQHDEVSSDNNTVNTMPNTVAWIANGRSAAQQIIPISITTDFNDNLNFTANHQHTITDDNHSNCIQQMLQNHFSKSDAISTYSELSHSYPSEYTDQVNVQRKSCGHEGEAMTIQSLTTNTTIEKYFDLNGNKSVGSHVEELPKNSLNENGTSENLSTNSCASHHATNNYDVDFHRLEDNSMKFQSNKLQSNGNIHENVVTNMKLTSGHNASQTHLNPPGEGVSTNLSTARGYVYEVTLFKGVNGLGMNLAGGGSHNTPVTIKKIAPGTAANNSRQLRVGDVILEVNGKPVSHLAAEVVLSILRACPSSVKLLVRRPNVNETDQNNTKTMSVHYGLKNVWFGHG